MFQKMSACVCVCIKIDR